MSSYQKTTPKGYDFYEVASAFQKSIRRGMEKESIFWGIELYEAGCEVYAWKRMLIMSCEDVGLADPLVNTVLVNLKSTFDFLKSMHDAGGAKLPYTMAILTLVRAKKSRLVDNTITAYWQDHEHDALEIPDWALDSHTRRGKALGRGLQFFYEESAKLNNRRVLPQDEEREAMAKKVDRFDFVQDEPCPIPNKQQLKNEIQYSLF